MKEYFVGEGLEDGGFAAVVETEHEDAQFFFLVLAEVAKDADESACLSGHSKIIKSNYSTPHSHQPSF